MQSLQQNITSNTANTANVKQNKVYKAANKARKAAPVKTYNSNSALAKQYNAKANAAQQAAQSKTVTKNWAQQVAAKKQARLAAQAQRNAARAVIAAAKAAAKKQKRKAATKHQTPLLDPRPVKVVHTPRSKAANSIVKKQSAHFKQTIAATNKQRSALNLPVLSDQQATAYYKKYMHNVANAVPAVHAMLNQATQQTVQNAQAIAA